MRCNRTVPKDVDKCWSARQATSTLVHGSVAQPIERVSAASAVPPNSAFQSKKDKKQIKKKCYLYCLGNVCSLHTKHNVVGNISHGCRLTSGLSQTHVNSPRGLMDKASVSEAEDCGFESRRGYDFCVWNIFKRWQTKNNIRIEWFWWDSNSHLCEVMYPLRLWCTMLSRGHNQAHSVRSSL